MAWGYGDVGYGAHRTAEMLSRPDSLHNIRKIVESTQEQGPAAGWNALLSANSIPGLGMSFGTKVLYFAGYSGQHSPRALVLDDRVRWSLYDLARGTVPPPGRRVQERHYLAYLELAQNWAADPKWEQEADVVEYGLFALNGKYPIDVVIPRCT